MNGWCWHPPEELMRVYQARRVLNDRLLCALCGTFVYLLPDVVTTVAVAPGAHSAR